MKYLTNIISSLVIGGSIIALTVVLSAAVEKYMTLRQQEIEFEGRYQCAQTYRYTKTEKDGVTVSYPMTELYQKCLDEKDL